MKHLLAAAMLFASVAQAATPRFPVTSTVVVAQGADTSVGGDDEEDEDEEEEEGTTPAPTPPPASGTGEAPAATTRPADAPVADPAAAPAARQSSGEEQRLVNGAPLYNPNVAVHIVEKKRFADEGKHEFVLYPAAVQVNGKFTQHVGHRAQLRLPPAGELRPPGHAPVQLVLQRVRLQPGAHRQGARAGAGGHLAAAGCGALQAGVEVTPIYGKFAFYDDQLRAVQPRAQRRRGRRRHAPPAQARRRPTRWTASPSRPTFGDTGMRSSARWAAASACSSATRFAVRLEVRDLVYTARVDKVNGCNVGGPRRPMERARAAATGRSPALRRQRRLPVPRSSTAWTRTRRQNYREDIILARDLVAEPSSDVLNNVSFYAGFSVLF